MVIALTILSVLISLVIVLAIGGMIRLSSRQNKLLLEKAEGMAKDMGVFVKFVDQMVMPLNAPIFTSFAVPQPSGATIRVFGFVMFNALTKQFQLVMTPAADIEQARKFGMETMVKLVSNPHQWKVIVESVCDVLIENVQEVTPKKVEKPVSEFVHSLMYVRDKFVESDTDREVLGKIIKSIEEKYAKELR